MIGMSINIGISISFMRGAKMYSLKQGKIRRERN